MYIVYFVCERSTNKFYWIKHGLWFWIRLYGFSIFNFSFQTDIINCSVSSSENSVRKILFIVIHYSIYHSALGFFSVFSLLSQVIMRLYQRDEAIVLGKMREAKQISVLLHE